MKLVDRILTRSTAGYDVLRLALCLLLSVHGWYRFYEGSLPVLGQILESHGFPHGLVFAWLVNLAEVGGTVLLALRILAVPVALILAAIYATGIVLFHWDNGFFVVGPGEGGWEYSALLVVCLLVTAGANTAWGRAAGSTTAADAR